MLNKYALRRIECPVEEILKRSRDIAEVISGSESDSVTPQQVLKGRIECLLENDLSARDALRTLGQCLRHLFSVSRQGMIHDKDPGHAFSLHPRFYEISLYHIVNENGTHPSSLSFFYEYLSAAPFEKIQCGPTSELVSLLFLGRGLVAALYCRIYGLASLFTSDFSERKQLFDYLRKTVLGSNSISFRGSTHALAETAVGGRTGQLTPIDSQRFTRDSWFTAGIESYIRALTEGPLWIETDEER